MRRLIHWISLLALVAILGTFTLGQTASASALHTYYCFVTNGKLVCVKVPVAVDRWKWDDCLHCGFEWNDPRILTTVVDDLQVLVTLDSLTQYLSSDLEGVLTEQIRVAMEQLDLPADVAIAMREGRNSRAWFVSYTADDGRTVQLHVPTVTEMFNPEPTPWIIDEQLEAATVQDLQMLATMQAVTTQMSPELSDELQITIQEQIESLPIPDDSFIEFSR
ncbi:MAG: hypothetical protein GFH27_549311n66 [Chloroflexi bacterium AL-W]|nr:hypothetical protein [Chloroflexi bacterium AL-N1]NOK68756.1 hypothetical protein [Chloroflexi bacterium AL-N10]NOK76242.1 hypothetical protein [Chloroflexi bacterium AL-N5]NOK84121.1 hypothetical protein [Chloroflexi bacterium AL-W]NOK91380.1 hypothetical protein [Chloroflexi bacterium AL-N15]